MGRPQDDKMGTCAAFLPTAGDATARFNPAVQVRKKGCTYLKPWQTRITPVMWVNWCQPSVHVAVANRCGFEGMQATMSGRFAIAASAILSLILWNSTAQAQFQLPGANFNRSPAQKSSSQPHNNNSERSRPRAAATASPANPGKPVKLVPPSETTLAGESLRHDGRHGVMRFEKSAGGLSLTRLTLDGEVISKPGASCKVEVAKEPFPVQFTGYSQGLRKYSVAVPACPFTFVVLDGALISTHRGSAFSSALGRGTCEFVKQDCRGYLAGVWGPSGRSFSMNSFRSIEKARGKSDRDARANFRALLRANRGDRKGIRAVAADQAGFSSRREVLCRDYLQEHVHGFCASRVTEARAIELGTRLNETITRRSTEINAKRAERRKRQNQ
jgi:hypothetical protein